MLSTKEHHYGRPRRKNALHPRVYADLPLANHNSDTPCPIQVHLPSAGCTLASLRIHCCDLRSVRRTRLVCSHMEANMRNRHYAGSNRVDTILANSRFIDSTRIGSATLNSKTKAQDPTGRCRKGFLPALAGGIRMRCSWRRGLQDRFFPPDR